MPRPVPLRALLALLLMLPLVALAAAAQAETGDGRDTAPDAVKVHRGHALVMHGDPKYPPDFKHFDYVNPDAPKGGTMLIGEIGTFDNLNAFILRGNSEFWSRMLMHGYLMKRSEDEPFSLYPWIADEVAMPEDRSWVEFRLDPRARFSDGSPIGVDDVIFSMEILRSHGQPFFGSYFRDVKRIEKTGPRTVRFILDATENRELPLIIAGDLPILSKAFWSEREFDRTTLDPIVGSGPYRLHSVDGGRRAIYKRIRDYWATELPSMRGYYNPDFWRVDYYMDATVAREALKNGEFDYRLENTASAWATAYDTPAVRGGLLVRREIEHDRPQGMQAFVFNTRRELFRDWRVRRALAYAFDYEWTNANLFYDQYVRTKSYFANSELASSGLPEGRELEILEGFRGRIPDSVFDTPYTVPDYETPGAIREGLKRALDLLDEAGWEVRDMRLVNKETGEPFVIEIMTAAPAFTRILLPFARNLRRLGIDARVRLVDQSQYLVRVTRQFDFDIIVSGWGQSESPGNEQRIYWSSKVANMPGTRNFVGIADPAIDELVELLIAAPDREELVARVRALDRVLLHHHFVIPQWHIATDRVIYWDKFGLPEGTERRGIPILTWWIDPEKAERLRGRIRSVPAHSARD